MTNLIEPYTHALAHTRARAHKHITKYYKQSNMILSEQKSLILYSFPELCCLPNSIYNFHLIRTNNFSEFIEEWNRRGTAIPHT